MEKSLNNRGSLVWITVNEFFSQYLNGIEGDFDNYTILIVSKDIVSDLTSHVGVNMQSVSKFEDINFVPELFPNSDAMQNRYGASMNTFAEIYKSQLDGLTQGQLLCSIVDLVVSDNRRVYLLCSQTEKLISFMEILTEVMFTKFAITMHGYDEIKENPELEFEIGDINEIKMSLQFQINNLKLIDENVGIFMNMYATNMAESYRNILMNKSMDDLYAIGVRNNIHVNRHKSKEYIVDHIMSKLLPSLTESELPFK